MDQLFFLAKPFLERKFLTLNVFLLPLGFGWCCAWVINLIRAHLVCNFLIFLSNVFHQLWHFNCYCKDLCHSISNQLPTTMRGPENLYRSTCWKYTYVQLELQPPIGLNDIYLHIIVDYRISSGTLLGLWDLLIWSLNISKKQGFGYGCVVQGLRGFVRKYRVSGAGDTTYLI